MKVIFTEDVSYDGGGHAQDARKFSKGSVEDLPEASARHWIHRHKAVAWAEGMEPVAGVQTQQESDAKPEEGKQPAPAKAQSKAAAPAKEPLKSKRNKLVNPEDTHKKAA